VKDTNVIYMTVAPEWVAAHENLIARRSVCMCAYMFVVTVFGNQMGF